MLDSLFSAPIDGAQSHLKKFCPDCNSPVYGRTLHKQFCEECKRVRKLENYKRAANKQRRKNGIKKVKGETFACEECGKDYVATSKSRQKWCPACKPKMNLARARMRSFADDRGGTRTRVKGKILICVDCSADFVARRAQVRCDDCILLVRPPHCGETACGDCGVFFASENRKKKFCADCLLVRRREASRKCALRRFREKRGEPEFDLNIIMRTRIAQSLRTKKNRVPWINFVDYTVAELKAHLERQFLPGMTWQNRKLWHVDHVRPLAQFSFSDPDDEEFKDAWALTNLRPIWAKDNIRKKDKRLFLI